MSRVDAPAPPLSLRPLGRADAPALQAVYEASADYLGQATGESPLLRQASSDLADAAVDDARHLLGIFLNNDITGVIDLRFDDPQPFDTHLGLVLLTPAYRRQGHGTWALRILEAWLQRDTPIERIVVSVPAQNHAAQGFFAANGYNFTGQSARVLIGDTRMRLLEMRKSLV